MNGGILGPAAAPWATAASWAAAGASSGWTARAAARLYLNAAQAATGAAGQFVVTCNATAFDASTPFASLGQNALVVPASYGGVYIATWGLNYAGGLGQFSQLTVNGTIAAQGSGSTRSIGASILQLSAGDVVKLQGQVSASESFGGGASGTDSWFALARYQ